MKPYEQITLLRKSGRLDEAYRTAIDWHKAKPKDPWRQLALFWVLRDRCKVAIAQRHYSETTDYLNTMSDLLATLPDTNGAAEKAYQALIAQTQSDYPLIQSANQRSQDDPLAAFEMVKGCYTRYPHIHCSLHESLGWILYRYLRQQREVLPSLSVRKALALYLKLSNPRPSRLHSLILNFALVYSRDHEELRLHPFFLLWDPAKFQAEDLLQTYRNNTTYPPLISQVLQRIVPQLTKEQLCELMDRLPFSKAQSLDYLRQAYLDHLHLLSRGEDTDAFWRAFNQYLGINPSAAPSKAHTGVLLLAHQWMQGEENWRFARFWLHWGVAGFSDTAWYANKEGEPSLVETVVKHAFSCLSVVSQQSPEILERFAENLRYIVKQARPSDWALHLLAMIEVWQGDTEPAIAHYKQLLLDHRNDYRYWLALAELVKNQPETHVALCCKTLLLESDPAQIGDLRLDLAQSLLSIGQSAEALLELKQYKENHPQPPLRYKQLIQNIETRVTILPAPGSYYERRVPQAEEYVFQAFPQRKFVLVERSSHPDGDTARLSDGGDILINVADAQFPLLRTLRLGAIVKMRVRETKVYDPTRIATGTMYRTSYEPLSCIIGNDPAWSLLPLYPATVVASGSNSRSLSLRTDNGITVTCYTQERPPVGARVTFRGYYLPLKEGKSLEVATFVR